MSATLGAAAARRPPFLRRDVRALFLALQEQAEAGCLAVVTHAEGSTYSKPGALMLFGPGGRQAGLLSGGCLEGDLAERAANVMATGMAASVTYDARDVEQDALFGLAFGCEGLLRIHLLPIGGGRGYAPLDRLVDDEAAGTRTTWSLVVDGRELLLRYAPPPRLLVLGAGAEAPAVATGALALGWHVTVLDHRPAWAAPHRFAPGTDVRVVDPRQPAAPTGVLDRERADAVVVMAHHLEVDGAWLAQLAATPVRWVGLLGPAARRGRLLASLGSMAPALAGRIQGPVGLPIGARTPEEIALSILAAAQQAVSAQD